MLPLDDITVLDLTRALAGPYCTMQLADMGARVLKIEHPERGDDTRAWGPPFVNGESAYFLSTNRGKESVTIDLKSSEGRSLLAQLIQRADVLVENFRPGKLDAFGLGYDALQEMNSRLVYCSISGFGHTGPRRNEAGYDLVLQAEAGLMSVTGHSEGHPVRVGIPIADIATGMFAVQGILAALMARERTCRGQHVDIAMLDSLLAMLSYQAGSYLATGIVPQRTGNRHPTIVPYETFTARDGDLVITVGNDVQFKRLCDVLDMSEVAESEEFSTNAKRVANYERLRPMLATRFLTKDKQEWLERLKAVAVPCGAVRGLDEVFSDPQVLSRGMLQTVDHAAAGTLRMIGSPTHLSENGDHTYRPPPMLGEHTDAVLTTLLGLSADEIEKLRLRKAI